MAAVAEAVAINSHINSNHASGCGSIPTLDYKHANTHTHIADAFKHKHKPDRNGTCAPAQHSTAQHGIAWRLSQQQQRPVTAAAPVDHLPLHRLDDIPCTPHTRPAATAATAATRAE